MKPVSREDVARLAGTSVAVVSYVVNGGPKNVSPERRARVLAAIEELGYRPNPMAQSLAGSGTHTIGMIVPNIQNSFFAELALEVEEAASKQGRLVFLGNSAESARRESAYVQSFIRHRVDGMIFIGVSKRASLQPAVDAGIPLVVVDRPNPVALIRSLSIDHAAAAELATAHLIGHGHTRIACLTGLESTFVSDERLDGFARAMAASDLDPSAIMRYPYSFEGGRDAWTELKRVAPDTQALFCASDDQARGVIAAALYDGVDVPGNLAVTSIDGTTQGSVLRPTLTSVRQPSKVIAQAALRRLFADEQAELHWAVPGDLTIGQSCGCPEDQDE